MKVRITLFFALIVSSGCAWAEGRCPPGYFEIGGPDVLGCAPMSGPSQDDEPAQPQEPQWATRWGAIAVGGGGGFGAAADMTSKRKAEKKAVAQCKATATDKHPVCTVMAFYNQCAVYAWGSSGGEIAGAINVSRAASVALERCGQRSDDCKVYYSNCSYAQRVD